MSVEAPPRKRAAIADPEAREFLRNADPVLARLIDARPDFIIYPYRNISTED
jgi:hypothetical protein